MNIADDTLFIANRIVSNNLLAIVVPVIVRPHPQYITEPYQHRDIRAVAITWTQSNKSAVLTLPRRFLSHCAPLCATVRRWTPASTVPGKPSASVPGERPGLSTADRSHHRLPRGILLGFRFRDRSIGSREAYSVSNVRYAVQLVPARCKYCAGEQDNARQRVQAAHATPWSS